MKIRFYRGLEVDFDHHLGYPVGYGGYTKYAFSTSLFGYFYRLYRWRKVAAGGHAIPNLVKIVL